MFSPKREPAIGPDGIFHGHVGHRSQKIKLSKCDAASTDPCCSADFTRTKRMAWISPQRGECEKISFEDAQHIGPVENSHRV
jgi:hypothetical protein